MTGIAPEFTHVDDWLDKVSWDEKEAYARWWLEQFRFPAWKRMLYEKFMKPFKLFCTYEGKRYRVTGASRMGDVWLAKDHKRDSGYDLRVNLARCSEWSDKP